MKKNIVVLRYLAALKNSLDNNEVKIVFTNLGKNIKAILENNKIKEILLSPCITTDKKEAILSLFLLELKAATIIKQFLKTLLQKNRFSLLPLFLMQIEFYLQQTDNQVEAKIFTSQDISDISKKIVINSIEKLIGKKIKPTFHKASGILGGYKVYIENTVLDSTVVDNKLKIFN